MKQQRIQLSRKKGWRMPENTVKVDRSTKWGNPFHLNGTFIGMFLKDSADAEVIRIKRLRWNHFQFWNSARKEDVAFESCRLFRVSLYRDLLKISIEDVKRELKGKNLACWCKPGEPCHADVLLKIANEQP